MSDLERLREAMCAFPEELAPRMMYVDELLEVSGCTRKHAESYARTYWQPLLDAARMMRAARLVHGRNPSARRLQFLLHRECPRPVAQRCRLLICRGFFHPCSNADDYLAEAFDHNPPSLKPINVGTLEVAARYSNRAYILVGANYVLWLAAKWQIIPEPMSMYQPEEERQE